MSRGSGLYVPGEVEEPPETFNAFDLTVNTAFNPASPVLKDGTVLTGDAITAWNGLDWLLDNLMTEAYTPTGTVENRALSGNLYQYARTVAIYHNQLMTILRLTGDVRALDLAVEIADLQYSQSVMTPDSGADMTAIPLPTHPYRRWLWTADSTPQYWGTDHHNLDVTRTHTPIAQLLYALRQNHGVTSPAGYDYEAKADMWEAYLRDFVKAWQGAEQDVGITRSGGSWVPASGWASKYGGNLHAYYTGTTSSSRRAGTGDYPLWPILSRHHAHTHVGGATLHYWLGKAIPDFADATPVGLHGLAELFFNRNVYYFDDPASSDYSGTHAVWPRGLHFTGHADDESLGLNYAQPSVYTSYVFMDVMNVWLEGGLPTMPTDFGIPVTKTMNTWMFKESNHAGSWIAGSLLDNATIAAAENSNGDVIPFRTAAGESGYGSASVFYAGLNTGGMFVAFDTSDNYLETYLKNVLTESSSLSVGSVGYTQPKVMPLNIGIILKSVGAKDWILDEAA